MSLLARFTIPTFLFLLFLTVSTCPAYADGIDFPLFLAWGIGIIVPVLAFNILGEALVLRLILSVPFGAASKFFLRANLFSLAGGIPTKILTAFLFVWLMPDDLSAFYHRYLYIAVLCILTYFVVTVLIEIGVGIWWYRKAVRSFSHRDLYLTILVANVLTYSVLGPLYYRATRPMWNEVDDITSDTSWARSGDERVFYVDADTHELMAIHADGSGRETWVPLPMREYLLSGDLNLCVFLGEEGDLHYYNRSTGEHVSLGPAGEKLVMRRVALSPSGKRVAVWRSPTLDSTLCVYEMTTGTTQTHTLGGGKHSTWSVGLAWSEDENLLYAEMENSTFEIPLSENMPNPIPLYLASTQRSLCPCFGRFNIFTWGMGENERVVNFSESCGNESLSLYHGLGSVITAYTQDLQSERGESRPDKAFAVNPGILHFTSWPFASASFLPKCEEIVLEDLTSIYLWDIAERKMGKVTRGDRHLVLTKAYMKERLFTKDRF